MVFHWSLSDNKSPQVSRTRIIIIFIIIPSNFFTPALVDVLSLESEWQQLFLSLQDFCQYSGRS